MRFILVSLSVLLVTLSSANAQSSPKLAPIPADKWIISQLNTFYSMRANTRLEDIRKKIEVGFRKKDLGENGISQQDYDIEDQINQARMRAKTILRWATNDLNGDGRVTRNEYSIMYSRKVPMVLRFGRERVATTPEQRARLTEKSVSKEMQADIDEDGAISLQEAIALSRTTIRNNYVFSPRYTTLRRIPPSFDKNQDGKITLSEFTAVSDRLLKRLDTDRNGRLDREEIKYYYQLRKRASKALLRDYLPGLLRK